MTVGDYSQHKFMDLTAECQCVLDAIHRAGDQALQLQSKISVDYKPDGSPVSDGDRVANDIIVNALQNKFPADAILSEEIPDDKQRLHNERVWIIDPIDGTSSYVAGRHEWIVQIALAVNNELVLGALYAPQYQRCMMGIPGQGTWLCNQAQEKTPYLLTRPEKPILLGSRSKRNNDAMEKAQTLLPEFSYKPLSSVGMKVDYMLQGHGSAYVNPAPIHEWDYAAPAAVLIAAGGKARGFQNQALPINSPTAHCTGIIFSSLDDHDHFVGRMQALQS